MDYPIHIDTISMDSSIVFKGVACQKFYKFISILGKLFLSSQTVQTLMKYRHMQHLIWVFFLFVKVPVYQYMYVHAYQTL